MNPRGRPIRYTRAERIRLGLPLCLLTPVCPRAPTKGRASCPGCRKVKAHVRHFKLPEGPRVFWNLRMTVEMAGQVVQRAEAEQLSGAEWVRRALARELAQTPPSSGS